METKIKYCPINGYLENLELEGRHAFKFPKEYNDRYHILPIFSIFHYYYLYKCVFNIFLH